MTRPLSEILNQPSSEAAEDFVAAWYGTRPSSPIESRTTMPAPLRRFYGLIAARPDAIVQNVLLSPPDFPQLRREDWAKTRIDDDKLVFYVENQGVCEWATASEETDDAAVWVRGDTLGGTLEKWEIEEPPLAAFLVELLVFEAVMGASHGASVAWLDRRDLGAVLGPLRRLALGSWRWPSYPTEFYAGDRILAVVGPNPGPDETEEMADCVSLWIGALDSAALAYMDTVAQSDWESFSRRDGPRVR